MTRRRLVMIVAAVVLTGLIAGAALLVVRDTLLKPKTITAYFTSVTAIYPGDDVRISGVKVGSIKSVQADGTQAKMVMNVGRDVPIPADAKAVIVAQNLVAARYVTLAPAYRTSGPTMPDNAVIPIDRTAVPVEWDEVKSQLMRLATELGPNSRVSTPSVARFIDSAADALAGNGDKLRQTLAQLSGVGRILADGSGNIVDIIKGLQTFVTALRDSNTQIEQFQDRFATLTSVLNDSRSDLDAALTNLSVAVGEVQRFIAETRDKASEQVLRLADVTQNLADHRKDLEQLLHIGPTGISNFYNAYNPNTGTVIGSFVLNNLSNPVDAICTMIGGIENTTAPETAKLCAQYLGPALRLLNFNYLPIPFAPYLMPAQNNLIYSEPRLMPGGAGAKPGPPETPPAVSAYTGLYGDVPPPPGYGNAGLPPMAPGIYSPLPAAPSPALYPGSTLPRPPGLGPQPPENLGDMLMGGPPPPPATGPPATGPAEAQPAPPSGSGDGSAAPANTQGPPLPAERGATP
ncbi:MAG: MCE family protein [Mycobacteriaceae bacterium]|nr:MCE family protein [Mycobacteriaceae bacterium]MBV9639583.1 MCE family protein [Mycobacteriaceae bacterium]